MRLASYRHDGREGPGVLVDGDHVAPLGASDMVAFLESGADAEPIGEALPLSDVQLVAPLRPVSLRDCMTFERHVLQATRRAGLKRLAPVDRLVERATGWSLSKQLNRTFYKQPIYYKSNPRSVVGPEAEVRIPSYCQVFDYELEWAAVIGRQGVDIPVERAREHIAGYTIFNDFSARDAQLEEMGGRLGPAKGKDFDTGNVLGPWIVTPEELADPYALTMVARVNGAEWSRGSTGDMKWSFEDLIAHISQSETLYPGDVIGSGTVGGGCGLELGAFLKSGDVVELEIEGIGLLRNPVT